MPDEVLAKAPLGEHGPRTARLRSDDGRRGVPRVRVPFWRSGRLLQGPERGEVVLVEREIERTEVLAHVLDRQRPGDR